MEGRVRAGKCFVYLPPDDTAAFIVRFGHSLVDVKYSGYGEFNRVKVLPHQRPQFVFTRGARFSYLYNLRKDKINADKNLGRQRFLMPYAYFACQIF